MSEINLNNLLDIAKEVVLMAGKFLSEADKSSRVIVDDQGREVKIQADKESEKLIMDFLQSKTNFSILSEEIGEIEGEDKDLRWIIDPVDGSLNYSLQIPLCCVSIGLWRGDKPLLGVVYDFNRNELFSGITDQGAWLNDEPISVRDVEEKAKAIMFSGFPVKSDHSEDAMKELINNIQSFRKVRLIGSAALSLVYVAAGRADAYREKDIKIWDVAGGIPIIKASGGKVEIEKTDKQYCYIVYASNGKI